jgi:hypothetical protein
MLLVGVLVLLLGNNCKPANETSRSQGRWVPAEVAHTGRLVKHSGLTLLAHSALYFDARNRGILKFEVGNTTGESKKRPVGGTLDNCFCEYCTYSKQRTYLF